MPNQKQNLLKSHIRTSKESYGNIQKKKITEGLEKLTHNKNLRKWGQKDCVYKKIDHTNIF